MTLARVALLCPDLMFGSRVEEALRAAGHEITREEADAVVVDLTADGTDIAAVAREFAAVPRIGFYPHVDVETRRRDGGNRRGGTPAVKTAIVTGASSGIGEATARRLGKDGWRLLLVARREDRLNALADSLPDASYLALDLTEADAPGEVKAAVEERFAGKLELLVNNAGGSWRAPFSEGAYDNVRKTMELNFDSPVRLTEALLPLLRASAPSAVVNVASIAGRVARPTAGSYGASKAALIGWTDSLHLEERPHGVHVGLVLPGFVSTEGFPQESLKRNPATRWIVGKPEQVADAIVDAGPGRRAERIVPRGYAVFPLLRLVAPRLVRRVVG